MKDITQQTIALAKAALANPMKIDEDLIKAFTESGVATEGITAYDLQSPALNLYPVLTPLRNAIPRITGGRGIQANWKAVTGINVNNLEIGLGEGNRGGINATEVADYMAAFRGLGLDDNVTFEADYASEGFQDLKALASLGLLRAVMLGEEKVLLGGNSSLALGTTPTPTVVASNAGGSLAAATTSVICVALSMAGYQTGTVANGVRGLVSRTNADGSVDTYGGGAARVSGNATGVTTGNNGSLTASVASVEGAAGYAWFWGQPGSEVLGALTTINSVLITGPAVGTQAAASLGSGDNSTNRLVFDGLVTQTIKTGAGYYLAQPTGTPGTGTPLTADDDGGIVEINNALQWFWDYYRLSPETIWVSSQEQKNINRKIVQAGSNAAQRFVFNVDQGSIKGGVMVRSYLNPFSMDGAQEIPIKLHPNLPPGTMQFDSDQIPYSLSGVSTLKRLLLRRDYYQIEWPIKSRRREYGVYFDGVLQHFFPPASGTITNIGNG